MSRDFKVTVTATAGGTTYSPVYVPDYHANGFYVSLLVYAQGSANYTVQHTPDDPWEQNLNSPTNTAVWFNHEFIVSETTARTDGNYAFPVKGIRLGLNAAASATATFWIVQGEGYGG